MIPALPNEQQDIRVLLGEINVSHLAMLSMIAAGVHPLTLLERHRRGDWGDIGTEDRVANEIALCHGLRVFSAYALSEFTPDAGDDHIWILTGADRSYTCVILPEEY